MKNKCTDKQRVEIAKKEYKNYKSNKEITIDDGKTRIGYVLQVNDDFETGGQSYVITDQKADKAQSDPNSVKEVTILYQGSGNPVNEGLTNNVAKDWLYNDLPLAGEIFADEKLQDKTRMQLPSGVSTPQLKASSEVLNQTLKKYPNAKVTVYGHSLGSMNGQYALANIPFEDQSRVSGYLYEGPNIYSTLSPEQREMADMLTAQNKIHNYVDKKDIIAMGYASDRRAVGDVYAVDSKWAGDPVTQHMWGGYQFDKDGRLKCSNKDLDKDVDFTKTAIELQHEANKTIKRWETELKKVNGGGCSGGQKIFLEACQALAIVQSFQMSLQSRIDSCIQQENQWIQEAEEQWQSILNKASKINQFVDSEGRLSHGEILSALSSVGCTKEKIVNEPKEKYEAKKKELQILQDHFKTLIQQITKVIQHQVQTDQELSQLFQ